MSVVESPNFTNAQENEGLHKKTLYELTRHTLSNQSADIIVGKGPVAIGVDLDKVFVANRLDGNVSVINTQNNSVIGQPIPVGRGPYAIGVDTVTHIAYVANSLDGTVSVINTQNNSVIGDPKTVGRGPLAIGVIDSRNSAYVANFYDDEVSVIETTNQAVVGPPITVGHQPSSIGVLASELVPEIDRVYVANSLDANVSVINPQNNSVIGQPIPVGRGPYAIGVDDSLNRVYVANYFDNDVSVIDRTNNSVIGQPIPVGRGPRAIGVDTVTHAVYVANSLDGTVSVFNATTGRKIVGDPVTVGHRPYAIGVDIVTHAVYVANSLDGTVSVIDGQANKVVAGVKFNVKPFNTGHIECENIIAPTAQNIIAPTAQRFYIYSGSKCIAEPNPGFEFVSWQEDIGRNSTQLLKVASQSSFFDPLLTFLQSNPLIDFMHLNLALDFLHLRPDKSESALNITKFGSFTANFKALPSPIPPEYVATLFTVVVTAIVGSWLTPMIIGWRKDKRQKSKLYYYTKKILGLPDDNNQSSNLEGLKDQITLEYARGKISKEQFDKLTNDISIRYEKILDKEIDDRDINHIPNEKIKKNIIEAYSKGNITELHYKLLNEKISKLTSNESKGSVPN